MRQSSGQQGLIMFHSDLFVLTFRVYFFSIAQRNSESAPSPLPPELQ